MENSVFMPGLSEKAPAVATQGITTKASMAADAQAHYQRRKYTESALAASGGADFSQIKLSAYICDKRYQVAYIGDTKVRGDLRKLAMVARPDLDWKNIC